MEKAYSPAVWVLDDGFDGRLAMEIAVKALDMQSSPGIPYCREAPTNGKWLEWDGFECSAFKLDRLWHDVQLVLGGEYEQLIRVFIKMEPHKKTKAEIGRWRLIMAASLPVQVAWQMCFGPMNDAEIRSSYFIPSQQGLVMVGGMWRLYRESWLRSGLNVGLDKSAWDWTAPAWALDLDLEFRWRMCRGDRRADWMRLARSLYDEMFVRPTLVLSDGSMYQQQVPGIMKSGCVNTISSNSHMQVMLHILACEDQGVSVYPLPVACGDDTLQRADQVEDLDAYRKYGVVVKQAVPGLEFVGHVFGADGPEPCYLEKHIKKLVYTTDAILPDYLDSMARLYVHSEYYAIWEMMARRAGCPLPLSREAYAYWYDHSC